MPLSSGTRLGPYEILSSIGAGGMDEVYKARDTRLQRTIAVKILPTHLSSNPQSRERFDREAKAISSLSHPHICPLYDVGHQDGIDFLVMEYLEGETLAHRLRKGALAPEQVLQYAVQITDALDSAHRHGVIHRDLKPGNIMLTKSGAKIVDFGLAKVRGAEAAAEMTALPTETTPPTAEGAIIGTMQYMAPEQLEGKEADARTDIFALGAVLYEMATGRRAFEAKSRASLIAAILEREPPAVSTLQPLAAPALDHVVRTCLAKDPDARWQTAHDVLVELRWIADARAQAGTTVPMAAKWKFRERIAWGLVASLALALVAAVAFVFSRSPAEPQAIRLQFPLPDGMKTDFFDFPIISPDGQRVALPGIAMDGTRHLWLRSLNSLADEVLPGTEEATLPFWSPDGRAIAFFTSTELKQIDASGGPARAICRADFTPGGGTWNRDGVIVFSDVSDFRIFRVSATGGEPKPIIQLDKSQQTAQLIFPEFLPDGRHFLYLSHGSARDELYAASLNAADAPVLVPEGSSTLYTPPGFLIYGNQETLLARRFDPVSLRLTGNAIPIAEHVGRMTMEPVSLVSASENGVLVYRGGASGPVQLAWHNREGVRQGSIGPPAIYQEVALSPDERRVAVKRYDSGKDKNEIWVLEISTGILSREISYPSDEPHWSPNSRELAFSSNEGGKYNVYRKAIGGKDETLVFQADKNVWAGQWLPDSTVLVAGDSLYRVPLSGEGKATTLVKTDFTGVTPPRVSADGRRVAYYTNESGQMEVYIAAFPSFDEKRQVSSGGGCQPQWRKDGKELFYVSLDGKMMSVDMKGDTEIETSAPKALFRISTRVDTNNSQYAVSRDGKQFLFGDPVGEENKLITVVLNWAAGLRH